MTGRPHAATVIAEIGGNHGGDLDTAKEMIRVAAQCGADMVKFQKRDVEASRDKWERIERTDPHAFGPNEYEHRKKLEFSPDEHLELQNCCHRHGVSYGCSAWDYKSLRLLESMKLPWIKIPSAKNEAYLDWGPFETPIHVSLGMTDSLARGSILRELGPMDVPYACTSKYPSDANDVYLREVQELLVTNERVGFSGHHRGIALDVAAYALGAEYVERHFTLDRTSKGTDHAASLEPEGLKKLCRDLVAVQLAMKSKPEGLPDAEVGPWKKFKGGGR